MKRLAVGWLCALLALSSVAHAQQAKRLSRGWVLHPKIELPMGPNAVACSTERAFARSWGGRVVMFDGKTFSPLPPMPGDKQGRTYGTGIAAAADGGVFVEASGRVAHWNGTKWSILELPGWQGPMGAMTALGSGELVVVGYGRIGLRTGNTIASYDAGTWRELVAVAGTGLDDLWTAGQGGTVMRHDASGWARTATGTAQWLRGLHAPAANRAWAWRGNPQRAEPPLVLRWDGKTWSTAATGLTAPVVGMAGDAARPWAVTEETVLRWDGSAWATELAATELGQGYHRFVGICSTKALTLVGDAGGHALVRPVTP